MSSGPPTGFEFREFVPEAPLSGILKRSFYAHGKMPYQTEKILPTGFVTLIFNLGAPHLIGKSTDDSARNALQHWFEGLQTTPNYHTPTAGTHVVGLLFAPVGFHALFGHDMSKLVDAILPAERILPASIMRSLQAVLDANELAASHDALHELFGALVPRVLPAWLWESFAAIEETRGEVELEQLYQRSGRGARQVTHSFKRAVGVSPKVLCRIHRLLALLEAVDPNLDVNWTELAHDFGFYDQPHFNREFRKLSGLFPSEYLASRRKNYPDMEKGENVMFAPLD